MVSIAVKSNEVSTFFRLNYSSRHIFLFHCSFFRRSLFIDLLFIAKSISVYSWIRILRSNPSVTHSRIFPFSPSLESWKLKHNFRDTTNMVIAFNGLSSTLNPSGLRTFRGVFEYGSSTENDRKTVVVFQRVHAPLKTVIPFFIVAMKVIERGISKDPSRQVGEWFKLKIENIETTIATIYSYIYTNIRWSLYRENILK